MTFGSPWALGDAVRESRGLMSINRVSLENPPSWHSFSWGGHAIRGIVAAESRATFLAALAAGSTGLPLTHRRCAGDPHGIEPGPLVEVSIGAYVLRTEALQPCGHRQSHDQAFRHVIVLDEIEWTFSGSSALGIIPTDPSLSRWGFVPYGGDIAGEAEIIGISTGGTGLRTAAYPYAPYDPSPEPATSVLVDGDDDTVWYGYEAQVANTVEFRFSEPRAITGFRLLQEKLEWSNAIGGPGKVCADEWVLTGYDGSGWVEIHHQFGYAEDNRVTLDSPVTYARFRFTGLGSPYEGVANGWSIYTIELYEA